MSVAPVAEPLESRLLLTATLVSDINPNDAGSTLTNLTTVNGKTIFLDSRGTLDATDGTTAGTSVIQAGLNVSSVSFVVLGTTAYFENSTGGSTYLWKTDGTAAGTQQIMTLPPYPGALSVDNGTIYFTVVSGNSQLWKTDGTAGGTTMIYQFGNFIAQPNYAYYNGFTYFTGVNGTNDDLWRTDGTNAGTTLVKEFATGFSNSTISSLTAAGGYLYFAGTTAAAGNEPWRSDGTTAGTYLLANLAVGSSNSNPGSFVTAPAGNALFIANSTLYSTNGTTATRLSGAPVTPGNLFVAGSLVYFAADSATQLWQTDGTSAGTVETPVVNTATSDLNPANFALYGSGASTRLFMTIIDGITPGVHRWLTGGTAATTVEIDNGINGSNYTVNGTNLTFVGADPKYGNEPYFSDGTAAGTHLIANLTTTPYSSSPNNAISFGGKYYAVATPAGGATQWYLSNGSGASAAAPGGAIPSAYNAILPFNTVWNNTDYYFGTGARGFYKFSGTSVTSLDTSIYASGTPYFTSYNGKLYFAADSGPSETEIYQTDGTAAGSGPLTTLAYTQVSGLVSGGGSLYYELSNGVNGQPTLYRTDGTAAGTTAIFSLSPAAGSLQDFHDLVWFNNALFFTFRDGYKGNNKPTSLYEYTGQGSPVLVSTLAGAPPDYFPPQVLGNELVFAGSSAAGDDLWLTDGTPAGTHPLKASQPFGGYTINYINRTDNRVFFSVGDSQGLSHLWVTDGTDAGTFSLNVTIGGLENSFTYLLLPDSQTVADGQLFFVSSDTETGTEVWKTDGTLAGTARLTDVNPGSANADPSAFGTAGSSVLFAATEPVHGTELWSVPAAYGPQVISTTISATSVSIVFNENVGTSLSASSLTLQDLTSGQTIPGPLAMSYNSTTDTAVFTLPTALPAGRYRLTLPAGSASDATGQTLQTTSTTDFAWIPGSAVASAELIALATDGVTVDIFQSVTANGTPNSLALATPLAGLSSIITVNGAYASKLTIDATSGSPIPVSGIAFIGGTGTDTVTLLGGAGTHAVSFSPSIISYDGNLLSLTQPTAFAFDPGAGVDSLALAAVSVSLPMPVIGSGISLKQFSVITIDGSSLLTIPAVYNNGSIDHGDRDAVICQLMTVNGSIDLGDNDLIVLNNSPVSTTLSTYIQLIKKGLATSTGIYSSTAPLDASHLARIGIMQSSGGTVDGQATSTSSFVVKYTYYGDANLDGKVDGSDYTRIDSGFVTHSNVWSSGDFNYDGVINGSDYTLIDNAFNRQGASLATAVASSTPRSNLNTAAFPSETSILTNVAPQDLTGLNYLLKRSRIARNINSVLT